MYANYGEGLHYAYIFDRDDDEVTKWKVSIRYEPGDILRFATKMSAESSVVEGFAKYQDMIEALNIPYSFTPVIVPPSLYTSAYDVVGSPDAYEDLVDFTFGDQSWWGYGMNWAGAAVIQLLQFTEPIIVFEFSESSTFEARIDDFSLNLTFRLKYNYAEDANGNHIPEDAGDFNQTAPVDGGGGFSIYMYNGGGYTGIDTLTGLPWTGGSSGKCYAISCASITKVCNVVEIPCF